MAISEANTTSVFIQKTANVTTTYSMALRWHFSPAAVSLGRAAPEHKVSLVLSKAFQ